MAEAIITHAMTVSNKRSARYDLVTNRIEETGSSRQADTHKNTRKCISCMT